MCPTSRQAVLQCYHYQVEEEVAVDDSALRGTTSAATTDASMKPRSFCEKSAKRCSRGHNAGKECGSVLCQVLLPWVLMTAASKEDALAGVRSSCWRSRRFDRWVKALLLHMALHMPRLCLSTHTHTHSFSWCSFSEALWALCDVAVLVVHSSISSSEEAIFFFLKLATWLS